jgi:putative ABC transport system substrate-binding protein
VKLIICRWRVTGKSVICLAFSLLSGGVYQIVEAQPTKNLALLVPGSVTTYSARIAGFRDGLRDFGYVDGKNIRIEYRYADGKLDQLPKLFAEVVSLKPDLIVTAGSEAISAAKKATQGIPIVMASSGDAVTLGLVASLARPGGNITGLTNSTWELVGRRLELLKEIVPILERVAFLVNPDTPQAVPALDEANKTAQVLGIKLESLEVNAPEEIERIFRAAAKSRINALVISAGAFNNFHRKLISESAIKARLPTVANGSELVEGGALMSYGVNTVNSFRRAATYVDKILKGAKPADLPVEQPTKFELAINLKTAKQIGLTIPQTVLARADRVIR